MGGGFGAYEACEHVECGYFRKDRECPVCEGILNEDGSCKECGSLDEIELRMKGPPMCMGCMRPLDPNFVQNELCTRPCRDGAPCGYYLGNRSVYAFH